MRDTARTGPGRLTTMYVEHPARMSSPWHARVVPVVRVVRVVPGEVISADAQFRAIGIPATVPCAARPGPEKFEAGCGREPTGLSV